MTVKCKQNNYLRFLRKEQNYADFEFSEWNAFSLCLVKSNPTGYKSFGIHISCSGDLQTSPSKYSAGNNRRGHGEALRSFSLSINLSLFTMKTSSASYYLPFRVKLTPVPTDDSRYFPTWIVRNENWFIAKCFYSSFHTAFRRLVGRWWWDNPGSSLSRLMAAQPAGSRSPLYL